MLRLGERGYEAAFVVCEGFDAWLRADGLADQVAQAGLRAGRLKVHG
jgi:hypothetical protein